MNTHRMRRYVQPSPPTKCVYVDDDDRVTAVWLARSGPDGPWGPRFPEHVATVLATVTVRAPTKGAHLSVG